MLDDDDILAIADRAKPGSDMVWVSEGEMADLMAYAWVHGKSHIGPGNMNICGLRVEVMYP